MPLPFGISHHSSFCCLKSACISPGEQTVFWSIPFREPCPTPHKPQGSSLPRGSCPDTILHLSQTATCPNQARSCLSSSHQPLCKRVSFGLTRHRHLGLLHGCTPFSIPFKPHGCTKSCGQRSVPPSAPSGSARWSAGGRLGGSRGRRAVSLGATQGRELGKIKDEIDGKAKPVGGAPQRT